MANRFPLIANSSANQIQELAAADNLDLTSSGIVNVGNIQSVGIVTATSFSGNISGVAATFTGNVSIAGTLTYEDVTNIDSIGIVTARAGIILGPTANTIRLGTGTTISSPSSDTFTILTGGSERVRVDSSGRVGIGSSAASPNQQLHIRTDQAGYTWTRIDNQSSSASAYAGLMLGAFGNSWGIVNGSSAANSNSLAFVVDAGGTNTERARISSSGGVSIGTTANPGAGAIFATGDITAFYSSDIRLKKDIQPISEPIKKLMEISGVTYKWNEEYLKDKDVDGYFVRETEVGVIAQDVEKVLPEVVATRENGYKAVRYEKLVALLIEAVKDQQKQIDELKARLEEV
jgi:hypothetical protein